MNENQTIILTNESGKQSTYTVLFTCDSKTEPKSYIAYTDFSKDDNNNTKVWFSSYSKKEMEKLQPIKKQDEINLLENILSTFEEKLNSKFTNAI